MNQELTLGPTSTKERLRNCLPTRALDIDENVALNAFAFDSLDTVEFLCAVHEEFGVRLTDEDIRAGQTVAGLAAAIAGKASTPELQ